MPQAWRECGADSDLMATSPVSLLLCVRAESSGCSGSVGLLRSDPTLMLNVCVLAQQHAALSAVCLGAPGMMSVDVR